MNTDWLTGENQNCNACAQEIHLSMKTPKSEAKLGRCVTWDKEERVGFGSEVGKEEGNGQVVGAEGCTWPGGVCVAAQD